MKFSLWRIMLLLTAIAVAVAWREPLNEALVGFFGASVATYLVNAIPMLAFYLVYLLFSWFYRSAYSPIWKLGAWVSKYRDRPRTWKRIDGCYHQSCGRFRRAPN